MLTNLKFVKPTISIQRVTCFYIFFKILFQLFMKKPKTHTFLTFMLIILWIFFSTVCSRPRDTGPCYAAFQRWWYNKATNDCQPFIYGGCQGNENNFETRQACLQRCRRRRCRFFCLALKYKLSLIFMKKITITFTNPCI